MYKRRARVVFFGAATPCVALLAEVLAERFGSPWGEARAAATFDHPNLCPVYDVGEVDGVRYLTMPYIEGQPLSEVMRSYRALQSAPRNAEQPTRELGTPEPKERSRPVPVIWTRGVDAVDRPVFPPRATIIDVPGPGKDR